ncbi:MAG: PepSY-associated TM helix domain-containing protein [Pseudomonadota bacterium]
MTKKKFNRGAFYRACRMWHGYLSAAAFIMLIFFASSGILLNHPDWLGAGRKDKPLINIQLSESELQSIKQSETPETVLTARLRQETRLIGQLKDAEFTEFDGVLRFAGVKGKTDVFLDFETGIAEVEVQAANVTSIIHDLHRGKDAGAFWKAFIDITAGLILLMSIAGLILFFSLRFRLAKSLKIMGGMLGVIALLFVFLTP